jgi:hypothetical protein
VFDRQQGLDPASREILAEIAELIRVNNQNQAHVLSNQGTIMAAIDDLNAAVSKLTTDVGILITNSQGAGGTSDAAIEAAVATVQALDAQVVAATPAAPVVA